MALASEIVRIENADPADASSPAELDRANLARLCSDRRRGPLRRGVRKAVRVVLAGGDPASVFAYWMVEQRKSREGRGAPPWTGCLEAVPVLGGERRRGLGGETL
jgi:hypothetical protein